MCFNGKYCKHRYVDLLEQSDHGLHYLPPQAYLLHLSLKCSVKLADSKNTDHTFFQEQSHLSKLFTQALKGVLEVVFKWQVL